MRIFPIDEKPVPASTESPATEPPAPTPEITPTKPRRSSWRRIAIAGIALSLIAAAGFAFNRYYRTRQVRFALEPLVQNITLRTANDIRLVIDPGTITYKEVFEKLDKDKSEIDSKIIDIQTIENQFSDDSIGASLKYAKSCQELLRAIESKAYKQLAQSSALEWKIKARDLYESSGYYGRYYTQKSYTEATTDLLKKTNEFVGSVNVLAQTINDTEGTRATLGHYLSDKFILEKDLLAKLASQNEQDRPDK